MNSKEKKFDAIVAFPFGSRTDYLSANWHIAMRAEMLAVNYGLPLVAHVRVPVGTIVVNHSPWVNIDPHRKVEVIDGYTILDTANNFYSFAGRETWRKILLVTAPVIAGQCTRDIERASGGLFSVKFETALGKLNAHAWFDRTDKQFLVRHPIMCCAWQLALNGIPWSIYRRYATTKR